jgi:ABC-type Fe3+/spermidine/putrescine transport system ATPase subunit
MLNIRHLKKQFLQKRKPQTVIDDLSLDIAPGEIFTLLGPSGCGKTTLLRLIAGLDTPDSGQITFKGRAWVDSSSGIFVPPSKRGVGLVFQSYAVWPHLNVFDNVAYPLHNQKLETSAIRERVLRTLDSVGLAGLEERASHQLSGGQQQRVAMARALVANPGLLLLDEPFSNLDVGLRQKLRLELRDLQRQLGLTVILVTHDQDDAFALSDRIAVIKAGRVEQIGTAEQLHDEPTSPFVHDFIGKTSQLNAVVDTGTGEDTPRVWLAEASVPIAATALPAPGTFVELRVRPEDVALEVVDSLSVTSREQLSGEITHNVFSGDRYETYLRLDDGQQLMAYQRRDLALVPGQRAAIHFRKSPSATPSSRRSNP